MLCTPINLCDSVVHARHLGYSSINHTSLVLIVSSPYVGCMIEPAAVALHFQDSDIVRFTQSFLHVVHFFFESITCL